MKETINELLSRPLWQMNGEEFCQLLDYTLSKHSGGKEVALHRIYGDAQLAEYLGCSEAQVRKLKKLGVFNPAIVPSVGKTTVYKAEEAQRCVNSYKAEKGV